MSRLFIAILLSAALLPAQVISTFAGTEYTFPADAVPARDALLYEPWALTRDRNGFVYFSQGNQILRVSPDLREVSVYAGNGIAGFSGDGGDARSASLNGPTGLTFDAAGELYFSDSANHRVRRIRSNGTIITVAGNGKPGLGAEDALPLDTPLNNPTGIAFDPQGRLLVSDTNNHRVRRIEASGRIRTMAGSATGERGNAGDRGPATAARLAFPLALHFDGDGNLFIADDNNKLIRRVSPDGIIITVAGTSADGYAGDGQSALTAAFRGPRDARPDGSGGLLIADHFNRRVRRVNPAGRIDTVAGNGRPGFSGDGGLATEAQLAGPNATLPDSSGAYLIADAPNRRLRRVSGGIINTVVGAGIPAANPAAPPDAQLLGGVSGIRMDAQRNLYFTDRLTHRLMRFSPTGTLSVVAGNGVAGFSGDNGPATQAQLNAPWGFAIDRSGNIYIAEYEGDRIRKVAPNGTISTVAGTGTQGWNGDGPALTQFVNHPKGITVDSAGNVYWADFGNNRIRRITPQGNLETIAGTGVQCPNNPSACFNGDNRPALQTNLYWPGGIAIAPNGTIYISDTLNHCVRRFTVGGTMTIVAGTGQLGYTGDGGPGNQARLNQPMDLALDSVGNLYIADSGNNAIRLVQPNGNIRTFAGTSSGAGFGGDGGLATEALLNAPVGLFVTPEDDVLIADTGNQRIRRIPALAPAVPAPTPAAITLSAISAGPVSEQATVNLGTGLPGIRYAVALPDSAPWLKVSQTAGALPSGLQLWADPANLEPGDYTANLVIATPTARPIAQSVQVSLRVAPPVAPALKPAAYSVLLRGLRGGRAVESSFPVAVTGSGALDLTYSLEGGAGVEWLSLAQSADTATPATPALVRLTANPAALAAGTYTVRLVVRGTSPRLNAPLESRIPVTLVVQEPRPQLTLSREALTFEVARGSATAQSQPIHVLNTGQGALTWRATASTLSGGNWLNIETQPSAVQVGLNTQTLAPGNYFGTVTIDAGAAGSRIVVVQLTVAADGSALPPEMLPSALVFTGLPTDRPGSQTVTVVNRRATPVTYTTIANTGAKPWLRYLPSSATIPAGGRVRVAVQPDFEQLSAGLTTASLLFRFDDGTSQTVTILASIEGDLADPKTGERSAACSSENLTIRLLNGQSPVRVRWGQPFNLDFSITDNCGRPIPSGPTGSNLVAGAFSTGESGGPFIPSAGGAWTRTFSITSPTARSSGKSTLKVAASAQAGGFGAAIGFTEVAFTVTDATVASPRVDNTVNGASFEVDVPVAPGSVISLFGEQLGPDGTEVLIGDRKLPLLYSSNNQVNAQVPFSLEENSVVQLRVRRGEAVSPPAALAVAPARPAVFTADQTGTGRAAAINQDGTINGPDAPAPEGTIVAVYCTGLGRVSPEIPDGQPASSTVLSRTVNPVAAFINGQPAQVFFAGAAPGLFAAYQVNVMIPAGAAAAPEAVLTLQTTGQESVPVRLNVRGPVQ